MIRVTTVILLLANIGRALGQSSEPRLEWQRTLQDAGNIVVATWSPTASCIAVATDTTVHVISSSGQPLWKWNFHETNRLIHVRPFGTLAVAPTCDAVVIGGSSDYKYVWAANQRGRRTFLPADGTPLSVAFSLSGDAVALVTGGPSGYLLSPRLDVRWHGALHDLPVRWPSQVFSNRATQSRAVAFNRDDVDALFGAMRWGWGVSDSVSDDGQWRVVTNGQERGRRTTTIELWGPGAGGYRDRYRMTDDPSQPRWVKTMGCPGAELTRDGAFVIATGDPDHPDAYYAGESSACDSGDMPTYFFDRSGNLVLTWPHNRPSSGMAAAFLARAGVPLRLQAGSRWSKNSGWYVPVSDDARHDGLYAVVYSPDHTRGFVGWHRELRVYSAPELANLSGR